jgi:hypothetical protein
VCCTRKEVPNETKTSTVPQCQSKLNACLSKHCPARSLAFLSFSWTPNPPSLPFLGIVIIENASQSPDSPPTLQLPSQLIRVFALKSPLTTNHQIIQRAPTKPTPTPAIPLPKTPSFHSPHPVPVGSAHTGDAAPSHQPCHLRRILT